MSEEQRRYRGLGPRLGEDEALCSECELHMKQCACDDAWPLVEPTS